MTELVNHFQHNFAMRMPGLDHFVCSSDFLKRENSRNMYLELPIVNHAGNLGQTSS